MKKIAIVCTNNQVITECKKKNEKWLFVGTLNNKETINNDIKRLKYNNKMPDEILCIGNFKEDDNVTIPTWQILIGVRTLFPDVKVKFICDKTDISIDKDELNKILALLIDNGIYDIYFPVDGRIDFKSINDVIDTNRDFDSCKNILKYLPEKDIKSRIKNVLVMSSFKPGSGKTTLCVNLAYAIAKYGQLKRLKDGSEKKPRVCIVDTDFDNYNASVLLRTTNEDKNINTALNIIKNNISINGYYSLNETEMSELKKRIRQCVTRHKTIDNLYILNGSANSGGDVYPAHINFLLNALKDAYDVIIVDTSSLLDSEVNKELFTIAGQTYLILDPDYNNLKNNIRYYQKLKNDYMCEKVHFILNKDISNDSNLLMPIDYNMDLLQNNGIIVENRIPKISHLDIKNLDYNGTIIVENLYDDSLKDIQRAILAITNQIWKIDEDRINEITTASNQQTIIDNSSSGVERSNVENILSNNFSKINNVFNNIKSLLNK